MNLQNLQEAISFFVYGFLELAVLFLVISFFVEIINVLINPQKIQRLLSSRKGGYLTASAMGAITPFCSCSSIPMMMGLIKAKADFGPIMTFLFTSPLLNPIIAVVFYITFGLKITLIYGTIALFGALLAGFTLEKLGFEKYLKKEKNVISCNSTSKCSSTLGFNFKATKEEVSSCCTTNNMESSKKNIKEKLFNKELVLKTWKQFVDFMPYIAIGIGIGAIIHGFIPQSIITQYAGADNKWAVPFSAVVGIPLYIRAATMVGLAPELLHQGVNMGSILALTIAGAGASLPEMIMLKKIFKLQIMIFFILTVFIMAIGSGYLVNIYFT
ncbi:MAG: permease [Campylobacteraceae bacterium]|nr:permease [Campylobacteraceae bacterium]